ncbi:MAG: hypothetical protein IKT42_04160 [Clostridia bacterium]|nr:hypothetical protein [Clostridia bacterium]
MSRNDGFPKSIVEQLDHLTGQSVLLMAIVNGNTTIMSADNVIKYLKTKYEFYKTINPIEELFTIYQAYHLDNLIAALDAFWFTHDLYITGGKEKTTVELNADGKITNEITHGKTVTTTPTDYTSELQTTTYDSTTYRPETKTTQSGSIADAESGKTTTEISRATKSLEINGVTYTADSVHGKTETENYQNLPIPDLIEKELSLREKVLIQMYLDDFISEYAYMNRGEFYDS